MTHILALYIAASALFGLAWGVIGWRNPHIPSPPSYGSDRAGGPDNGQPAPFGRETRGGTGKAGSDARKVGNGAPFLGDQHHEW